MKYFFLQITILTFIFMSVTFSQQIKVLSEDENSVKIQVDFTGVYRVTDTTVAGNTYQKIIPDSYIYAEPGKPLLPEFFLTAGIPFNRKVELSVISTEIKKQGNVFIMPEPATEYGSEEKIYDYFDRDIYYSNSDYPKQFVELNNLSTMRFALIQNIKINPARFNPVNRELTLLTKVVFELKYKYDFTSGITVENIKDPLTEEMIATSLVNHKSAMKFYGKAKAVNSDAEAKLTGYWYNPSKDWFKIYVNKKDVFRVSYQELVDAGVPLTGGVRIHKLEMFNDGLPVPIHVVDNGDSVFNGTDFFYFVGKPATPSPYAGLNIYNKSNVYWFSYQADTSGFHYQRRSGFPTDYQSTVQTVPVTLKFEEDLIYERFGYANDERRDYWYWGKANARNGVQDLGFGHRFETLPQFNTNIKDVRLKVNMHSLTTSIYPCNYQHSANILINDNLIGNAKWNGQDNYVFDKTFSVDTVPIPSSGNQLTVVLDGNVCLNPKNDEIRINSYEITYWRTNRVAGNSYFFTSPPGQTGKVRYWLFQWLGDSMIVLNPAQARLIDSTMYIPGSDRNNFFQDEISEPQDYYCIDYNYGTAVDSIVRDQSSDLRNLSAGADYIIITHPKFMQVAERLKTFRETHFPDETIVSPRIKIADLFQIYDEFGAGLMSPYAIRDYLKYAFENFPAPAPSYVVLIGDMSYDYRGILPNSRENFVPSIPFHSFQYGQAGSDNGFVAVTGEDVTPDMVLGRISIETVEEGNIFLDKLENYPSDNTKPWKENILLMASGVDAEDELQFGFNRESMRLNTDFLRDNGLNADMIFRYPSAPDQEPFRGGTLEIRKAFDRGAVFANYYGHGGGYQWDLTFLNNDIYTLQNGGRLPLIVSVTCYTAHFDNQDVFGEQFIKVPGKGAIGFFGSSGLTYWQIGTYYNSLLFDEIFNNREYVSGKAFFKSKVRTPPVGYYRNQIALLTYLGEPLLKLALPGKPDFTLQNSDISVLPENPLTTDSLQIKVKMKNYGVSVDDSVNVRLSFSVGDSSGVIDTKRIKVFANSDSVTFGWRPGVSGLVTLRAEINEDAGVNEDDLTDNSATTSFVVFNISEPNVLRPADGFTTSSGIVKFEFPDIGTYIQRDLVYEIEIDTSLSFENPLIKSGSLNAVDGMLTYSSPQLNNGFYFWRARVFDGENFGRWTTIRTFRITDVIKEGYYVSGEQLKMFDTYNLTYSPENGGYQLNTSLLPPKPENERLIEEIDLTSIAVFDTIGRSCFAMDDKYFYLGEFWYDVQKYKLDGKSKIYRVGTGKPGSGTVKGQYYGPIPGFEEQLRINIFAYQGKVYAPTIDPKKVHRIDPETGVFDTMTIDAGLLNFETGTVQNGYFRVAIFNNLAYNLAEKDTNGKKIIKIRVLDPQANWALVRDYEFPNIESFESISGFFVVDNYFYISEDYYSGYMRAVRLEDGFYSGDWLTWKSKIPSELLRFFAWVYDEQDDKVYATYFRRNSNLPAKISVFAGHYLDANGSLETNPVGPAQSWNKLSYNIKVNNSASLYTVSVLGYNSETKAWDTLQVNPQNGFDLNGLNPREYPYLRLGFGFQDTSYSVSNPMVISDLNIQYDTEIPELEITSSAFEFTPDSLLQGLDITARVRINNISYNKVDSAWVELYLNNENEPMVRQKVAVEPDSFAVVQKVINTSPIIFYNKIRAIVTATDYERFTFNNLSADSFFVVRDSINPTFRITFDGKEILNGDIISKKPEILISLKDNSPLPIDTTQFTLIYKNEPLSFNREDMQFSYQAYPNSEAVIRWTPTLKQGRHTLDVLAKDASNNFFDTTYNRSIFFVYENDDIAQVYNYPNPFRDDTYFTFELRGENVPDELKFRVYTIAGRLIREMDIPKSQLIIGFNKIHWDGRDQDGDEIANGTYLYRLVAKYPDKTKTFDEKLAKVK